MAAFLMVAAGFVAVAMVAGPSPITLPTLLTIGALTGIITLSLLPFLRQPRPLELPSGISNLKTDPLLIAAADEFPFGIVLYDNDLRIRFANKFARSFYDRPLSEIVGRKDSELLSEECVEMFVSELRETGNLGLPRTADTSLGSPQHRRMFMMSFAPIERSTDAGKDILSIWFETSKVDDMSRRLERLNRTLSTLTDANRILAGCETEEELLALFCQNLRERGGYTFAWLGTKSPDGSILPVATSGVTPDDLAPLALRWDEPAGTSSPIGTALSTGESAPLHRHSESDNDSPNALFHQKFGVRSCGAVPVKISGEIPLALCLCSESPDAFDEAEMELLGELARDLGCGLAAVRDRQLLKAEKRLIKGLLELNQEAVNLPEDQLICRALDIIKAHTNSRDGRFVLLGHDLDSPADKLMADTPATLANLVSTSISTGKPAHSADAPGLPGYAVAVPAGESERVAAVLLVSGKSEPYGENDLHAITVVTDDLWRSICRRRSDLQLARSQALLAQAQQIAQLGTWEYDVASRKLRWSDECARIHGWTTSDTIDIDTLAGLIHWDDFTRAHSVARQTLAATEPLEVELEYRIVLPNGEIRHVAVRGQLDPVNSVNKRFRGTIQDITSRKAEEDKRRSFENTLLKFLDNLPAIITLKDERLQPVYGNTAALELLGVSSEKFKESSDTAFFHEDAADCLSAAERSALSTHQPVNSPDLLVGEGAHERRLRGICFPVILPDGEALVGMYASDITDLEHANAKSTLLNTALESAANGVVITDVKGRIEWVNSAFTRMTGYTSEEVIGQTPRVLKSDQHEQSFYKKMWSTLLKGEVWNGEIKNRRKDGSIYDEQMTITPVRAAGGAIAHFIAIKLDISDQRQLEDRLLRSQRMESIGLLAGGVAHDLNNIIAPIMMGVELLRSPDLDASSKEDLLDTVMTSCERGAGIIRQVLTFARGIEGERVIVQLRHQVKDIVKMARETFPKDINVSMDMPSNFWTVLGDPTQLHQILLNFSVNARDAMPHGGQLTFTGENATLENSRTFQAFTIPPGRYAKLIVSDTGTGIQPAVLERMFEPFFTTKPQGKGTGLGLPTVLGIAKSHHGLIEIESTPGRGTRAIAWLPASETTIEGQDKPKSTPPCGHGETILVVDDETSVRKTIATILSKSGYQVIEAADGADAIAQYASNRATIQLVLTDVLMPVMDGVALAHALRRISPELRIIGSSGYVGDGETADRLQQLRDAGVRTVLQKPYTPRELLETLAAELTPHS